jgi:hypothetical protein
MSNQDPISGNSPTLFTLRRRVLRSIAVGATATGSFSHLISDALAKGDLPTIPGINQLQGKVTVNGQEARVGTPVKLGDKVVTGRQSLAVIVVDKDAFLIRENSELVLNGRANVFERASLLTGQMLSVFGKGRDRAIQARTATIGIRGTGAYVEVHDNRAYLCLCYGEAAVDLAKGARFDLSTSYHEKPLWLYDDRSERAPFLNHKDSELEMMEALFDREPPFKGKDLPRKYD